VSRARGARRTLASVRLGPLSLGLGLALAWASPARAQSDILEREGTEELPGHRFRSPQRFAVEVKFGPYRPDVDSEFPQSGVNKRAPYQSYFGDGRHLYSALEFDWQLFRKFGSIGMGAGIGYFSVTGTAPSGANPGMASGDTSGFKVVPVSLSAIYRFDHFLETRDIPLVPFGKLGLDWAYWQITDGNGEIAVDMMGNSGRGGTLGWHAAAGLALVLDWLDPEAARDFDADLGVNHTALTFEYNHADISGLGRTGRLHVGDTTWTLGLLLEF